MKRALAILGLFLVARYYFMTSNHKLMFEERSLEIKSEATEKKIKTPQAMKKLEKLNTSPLASLSTAKEEEEEEEEEEKTLSNTNLSRSKNPVSKHLNKQGGKYLWSENIFAIHVSDFKEDDKKMFEFLSGLILISAAVRPQNSYYIIRNKKSNKIGYYTGKIILITKEINVHNILDELGLDWQKISGTYIIEEEHISTAIELSKTLKEQLSNSIIDLDINYNQYLAK